MNVTMQLFLVVGVTMCSIAAGLPYRSTTGVLRTRPSMNEVLNTYLLTAQQRPEPQYGYPEYQPSYQSGYIANRPRRVQDIPLIQYLGNPEIQPDYPMYDLGGNDQLYTDTDGTWYDEAAAIAEPLITDQGYGATSNDFLNGKPTDQDIALAKLMLDHLAGKYSLEDLETLEREARIEENTENQLRALAKQMRRKKSMVMPVIGSTAPRSISRGFSSPRSTSRVSSSMRSSAPVTPENIITMSQRRGQKEEALMVPATSVRRPIFAQQFQQGPKSAPQPLSDDANQEMSKKSSANTPAATQSNTQNSPLLSTSTTGSKQEAAHVKNKVNKNRETGVVEVIKVNKSRTNRSTAPLAGTSSTSSSYMKPAYEALRKYLDTQRQARVKADEELFKAPQKRFVQQEPDRFKDELNNLKKTVV